MFKPSTLSVVRPLAETLTLRGLQLVPGSTSYPVARMAEHYDVPHTPTYQKLDSEQLDALSAYFNDVNDGMTEVAGQDFDQLVALMAEGVTKTLYVAQNQVAPLIRELRERYTLILKDGSVPNLSIQPVVIHPIHDNATLSAHLVEKYGQVEEAAEYRSFFLHVPDADTLLDWVGRNPHVDETFTKEWALTKLGPDLMAVFRELFRKSRAIIPSHLSFVRRDQLPFTLDKLLAAYFLTGYLIDEPQDVDGESVSLEEWELALKKLHQYFGALLLRAYEIRAKARQRQQLVWRYEVDNPIQDGRLVVYVNQDVYPDWLEQGGVPEVILGAAVDGGSRRHVVDLEQAKDQLIEHWRKKHYLIRQACLHRCQKQRLDYLRTLFLSVSKDEVLKELLPDNLTDVEQRLEQQLRVLRENDLDNDIEVVSRLVCEVFYPGRGFFKFLQDMERAAQNFPGMPAREAATLAAVDMVTHWLRSQIKLEEVTFDIRAVTTPVAVEEPNQPEPEVVTEEPVDDQAPTAKA